MKKIIVLLALAAVSLACKKEYYGVTQFVREFTVQSQHWQLQGIANGYGSYYTYGYNEPEITSYVFSGGNVQVFYMPDYDIQVPLPYTEHKGEPDVSFPGGEHLWTENYSYDFSPGQIYFYFDRSDFQTGNRPPTVKFRMVITK